MLGDGLVLGMFLLVAATFSLHRTASGFAGLALAGLAAQAIKFSTDVPRPSAVLPDVHLIGPELFLRSFPSGHSAAAFAVAGVLVLTARTAAGAILPLALAVAVAWSRVYVGVHYPLDTAVGALLGLAAAGLVTALLWRWREGMDGWAARHAGKVRAVAGGVYVVAGGWLFLLHRELPPEAVWPLAVVLVGLGGCFLRGYSRISSR
jgi:membrane-associated phospholipid phosphatase